MSSVSIRRRHCALRAGCVTGKHNPQQCKGMFADLRRGWKKKKRQEKGREGQREKTMRTETMPSPLSIFLQKTAAGI